ncbi:hypothetical protein KC675_01590 [Candidatus Dojkabacteria bacterium]|uniref:DUF5673 domain-containing protein n=1 Tax=Candidatus Dojkabacteria bacterium TaxID=2099670 RepID=A0A955I8P7_9BACT|nr:hypothetical protein [Candidatus Dojkabacteria bacterium]
MSEEKDSTLKSAREELQALDSQIYRAKAMRDALEEERKPIYSVYKWESPERVFDTKDKKWYLIVSSVSMFLIVLSLLTENYGLVIAIISLIVLLYALNSVPPQNIKHEITNKGISINSVLSTWKKITKFWISSRGEHLFLNITIEDKYGQEDQVISYLGNADVKKIVSYLSQYVDYVTENEINNNFIFAKLFGKVEPLSRFID